MALSLRDCALLVNRAGGLLRSGLLPDKRPCPGGRHGETLMTKKPNVEGRPLGTR